MAMKFTLEINALISLESVQHMLLDLLIGLCIQGHMLFIIGRYFHHNNIIFYVFMGHREQNKKKNNIWLSNGFSFRSSE